MSFFLTFSCLAHIHWGLSLRFSGYDTRWTDSLSCVPNHRPQPPPSARTTKTSPVCKRFSTGVADLESKLYHDVSVNYLITMNKLYRKIKDWIMFLLRLHSHAAAFVLVPFILLQRADVTDDTLPNSSCASVATRCQQQRYSAIIMA